MMMSIRDGCCFERDHLRISVPVTLIVCRRRHRFTLKIWQIAAYIVAVGDPQELLVEAAPMLVKAVCSARFSTQSAAAL